jgi:hypothetical protein
MTENKKVSREFKDYAWFSVQVDQYYEAIRIFARHLEALTAAYSCIPRGEDWPKDLSSLNQTSRKFFITASSALNYMGTTGIFHEKSHAEQGLLNTDIINFGFYTCFTFQWTLFENFVRNSIFRISSHDLVSKDILEELKKRESKIYRLLKYIDDGHVFGRTPFTTVLSKPGWTPDFEMCNFKDLDAIRGQRNKFIHAVENASILPLDEAQKELMYKRSMWILRRFAQNIDHNIYFLMHNKASM